MTTILYPTRGGASAYHNQDWAMSLAQERGADLLLLYVSNVHFLDHMAAPKPVELIENELEEMGEFLLTMAQERAEKAGLKAETLVRSGAFAVALGKIIAERDILVVVLGCPADENAVTSVEYINELASVLRDEHAVEVFVVREGKVINHLMPARNSENGGDGSQ